MKRFSVSIPDKLYKEFGRYISKRKYENRSEAVRDMIRESFVSEEWEAGDEVVGVINLVFDHHQRKLQDRLTDIQHDYGELVISATHVHLDHHNCLEVIIVRGKAESIQGMADSIKAVRGVKNSSLSATSTGIKIV
jgi:CopG family transcriptional regulator, nickel-responsive regulator